MIVCCAHSKRIDYLIQLIKCLSASRNFNKKIKIWIDEADESIKLWSKHEMTIMTNPKVASVTLVSATFDSVIKKYGRIPVMRMEKTHADCYHKFQESIITTEDVLGSEDGSFGYLKAIFEKHEDRLRVPGVRLFAPGDTNQESHNQIADFLVEKGFVVVILNGSRKEIIVPGQAKPFSLEANLDIENNTEELGKQIAKTYIDNNWSRFPLAITGHKCIGRGLTFQSENFLFDYGIIPYISDKANAYQTTARMLGNTKLYPGYKAPTIYMTSKMKSIVTKEENVAINISRMVYDNELQGDDGLVGKADIKEAGGDQSSVDTDKQYQVFDSQDEAIKFGKTLGASLRKRPTSDAPKELQKDGKNPSSDELFNRMWGINAKNCVRMIPTSDEKWCVYWRPSLLLKTE